MGCGDDDSGVRRAAIEATVRDVVASPQHAGEVLPTLANGCCDERRSVRQAAMEAICRIVAAAPQHVGDIFPTLAKSCGDTYSYVRQVAVETIGRVVTTVPQHDSGFQSTFAIECDDKFLDVCNCDRTVLKSTKTERIISQANSILPTYEGGFSIYFVQTPLTFDPFLSDERIPLVLHTTSSQEVGRWKKEDIDLYLSFLRQDFDDMFPELRQDLE